MNIDMSLLLILGGGCMVIGFALAGLINSMQRDKEPAPPDSSPGPAPDHTPLPGEELLRLLREPGQPGLLVNLEGRLYREAGELSEASRQRLKVALEEAAQWLSPVEPKKPLPAEPAGESEIAAATVLETPAVKILPSERSVGKGPLKPFIRALQPAPRTTVPAAPTGLAEQVDEVLQKLIVERSLPYSSLHLATSTTQSLLVVFGDEEYEGIDAVPDESVRALIREAVKEWEKLG